MTRRWFQNRKKRLRIERTCRRLKSNDAELTEIDWDDEDITDADLMKLAKALSKNVALRELHLCENDISKVGASELMFALRNNAGVRELWLSVNNICDYGAASMSGLLRCNTTLTWLNLNENNITSEGASYIASGLSKNKTLEYLWLNGNRICDAGAESLAKALASNGTIQLFSLAENRIGEVGAEALAYALRTNESVSVLGLYGNFMGDAGAESIALALSDNATLTELYLGRNGITSRGAVAFAEALQSGNSTLLKLWLAQNRVDDEGATALAYALTANATLQEINLGRNDITKRGARALAEALRTNTVLATTGLGGGGRDDGIGDGAGESRGGRFSNNSAASRCLARMSYGSSASHGLSYNSSVSHDIGGGIVAAGAKGVLYESERQRNAAGSFPEESRRQQKARIGDGGAVIEADSENTRGDVKIGTDARWQHQSSRGKGQDDIGGDEVDVSDTMEPQQTAAAHETSERRGTGSVPSPTSSFASGSMRDELAAEAAIVRDRRDSADMEENRTNGKVPINSTNFSKKSLPKSSHQHQLWDRAKDEEPICAIAQGLASVALEDKTNNAQTATLEEAEKTAFEGI